MKKREGCLKISFVIVMIILIIVALFIYIPFYSAMIRNVIKAEAKPLIDWPILACDYIHVSQQDQSTICRIYDGEKDNYCYIMIQPFNGISCVPGHSNLENKP
jgi:flagellar basal body-associated protein FliL